MKQVVFALLFVAVLSSLVFAQVCSEGQTQSCGSSDEGICQFGVQVCQNGFWSTCLGAIEPVIEVCDDNLDNDCDGQVDEECGTSNQPVNVSGTTCQPGANEQCGQTSAGRCEFGNRTCNNNGAWGICIGEVLPLAADICGNNIDDNCDGQVDEGCVTASCFDSLRNQGELGVDCGGPCAACETCSDRLQNQNETGIDCGGPCDACPTCDDNIQNQGELGVDCGGPCVACQDPEDADDDGDGLTNREERLRGTNVKLADSDNDGVIDSTDSYPLCPNNFCDSRYGENKRTCPQDCGETRNNYIIIIPVVIFGLILLFVIYLLLKFKAAASKANGTKGRTAKEKEFMTLKQPLQKDQKKTEMDIKLEKAMHKADKFFKK